MILCLIILIAGVISLAVGIFAKFKTKEFDFTRWDYISIIGIVLGVALVLVSSILLLILPVDSNKQLSNFISQKEYIENYEPTTEYDAAVIINKKIELNEWLYSAQYTKEHYPICSFYGDEILEIEPIK